jgi:pyruvate-formate lyase-activating enzyme
MRISYLAISEKRCTVQIVGCNFKCKGCFSGEKHKCGVDVSGARIANNIPAGKEVMLAGGEPTIDSQGLIELIDELKGREVILSTNGYLLSEVLLMRIMNVTVHIDLKAWDDTLHKWYTGRDNRPVLKAIQMLYDSDFDFQVSTVYIPDVIEIEEIENIARFLSSIGNINYKIMRYVPVGNFSRRPKVKEIESAVHTARQYLRNVSSSLENRSHPRDGKIVRLFL